MHNLSRSEKDADLVTAVVAMAHRLGLRVIAEGVEDDTQLAFLRDGGCDLAQGFYLGEPVPVDDFTEVLMGRRGQKAQA